MTNQDIPMTRYFPRYIPEDIVIWNTKLQGPFPSTDKVIWSGTKTPPSVGDIVSLRINNLGKARVTGYAITSGFLALTVELLDPPDWYQRMSYGSIVYGAEIDY